MLDQGEEFEALVITVLLRFVAQKGHAPPPSEELGRFAAQLRQLVGERGLPPALKTGESGTPGGMSDEAGAPLVARVVAGTRHPLFPDAARQLVKACFYPEFRTCRDSFREVAPDGSCRRQQIERAGGRMSGVHCVDCPYWVALSPAQHEQFLAREWRGDPHVLTTHRNVFLPEDFRALRRWLYAAARRCPSAR